MRKRRESATQQAKWDAKWDENTQCTVSPGKQGSLFSADFPCGLGGN